MTEDPRRVRIALAARKGSEYIEQQMDGTAGDLDLDDENAMRELARISAESLMVMFSELGWSAAPVTVTAPDTTNTSQQGRIEVFLRALHTRMVQGRRNIELFSAACTARDSGLDLDAELTEIALATGLPADEIAAALSSASSRASGSQPSLLLVGYDEDAILSLVKVAQR